MIELVQIRRHITMKKICKKCKASYDKSVRRCPVCKKRLSPLYSDEEKKKHDEEALIAATAVIITTSLM